MNGEHLVLLIVTPDGRRLKEQHVDAIVVRRRERLFELGSEIAIFPRHAPTLIRIPVAPLRYRKGERTLYVAVGGGFVEIRENEVLIVTPRFERMRSDDPSPSTTAKSMTEQWRGEQKEFRNEMVGYL